MAITIYIFLADFSTLHSGGSTKTNTSLLSFTPAGSSPSKCMQLSGTKTTEAGSSFITPGTGMYLHIHFNFHCVGIMGGIIGYSLTLGMHAQ